MRSTHVEVIESGVQDEGAEKLALGANIPPCPAILTKLIRETRAEEPDFRKVTQLVSGDVALASACLTLVNSALFGLCNKATSVHQAISLLGLDATTQMVTGLLLKQAFNSASGPGIERYWKDSTATALVAATVARESGRRDNATPYTYALFRDCGMPVMHGAFTIYDDILDGTAVSADSPILEVENMRYAMNHARVGYQLARTWHLSDEVCLAILHHHDMASDPDVWGQDGADAVNLVAIGIIADRIYGSITGREPPDWETGGTWAMGLVEISEEKLEEIATRVKAHLNAS